MGATTKQWIRDGLAEVFQRGIIDLDKAAAIIASHAPSEATQVCPGEDQRDNVKASDAAAQPDGYCSIAPTAPHPRYKDCINWEPEIEHNDH